MPGTILDHGDTVISKINVKLITSWANILEEETDNEQDKK